MAGTGKSLDIDTFNGIRAHVSENPADGQGSFETVKQWQGAPRP